MQLVEGQPLDRLIPDSGLPVERMLEIATGLAEALAAAHDRASSTATSSRRTPWSPRTGA
jgi:hypothetical protein